MESENRQENDDNKTPHHSYFLRIKPRLQWSAKRLKSSAKTGFDEQGQKVEKRGRKSKKLDKTSATPADGKQNKKRKRRRKPKSKWLTARKKKSVNVKIGLNESPKHHEVDQNSATREQQDEAICSTPVRSPRVQKSVDAHHARCIRDSSKKRRLLFQETIYIEDCDDNLHKEQESRDENTKPENVTIDFVTREAKSSSAEESPLGFKRSKRDSSYQSTDEDADDEFDVVTLSDGDESCDSNRMKVRNQSEKGHKSHSEGHLIKSMTTPKSILRSSNKTKKPHRVSWKVQLVEEKEISPRSLTPEMSPRSLTPEIPFQFDPDFQQFLGIQLGAAGLKVVVEPIDVSQENDTNENEESETSTEPITVIVPVHNREVLGTLDTGSDEDLIDVVTIDSDKNEQNQKKDKKSKMLHVTWKEPLVEVIKARYVIRRRDPKTIHRCLVPGHRLFYPSKIFSPKSDQAVETENEIISVNRNSPHSRSKNYTFDSFLDTKPRCYKRAKRNILEEIVTKKEGDDTDTSLQSFSGSSLSDQAIIFHPLSKDEKEILQLETDSSKESSVDTAESTVDSTEELISTEDSAETSYGGYETSCSDGTSSEAPSR